MFPSSSMEGLSISLKEDTSDTAAVPVEEQDPPDTEIEEKNVKITSDGKRKSREQK